MVPAALRVDSLQLPVIAPPVYVARVSPIGRDWWEGDGVLERS
jgi:hypothetical protein